MWCAWCGEAAHFSLECKRPPKKGIHYVQPEEDVYYTFPEEKEDDEELAPVHKVQSTYGRGRALAP